MIVKATDLKNNLGKYLRAAAREEVIITSNGRNIARLTAYEEVPEPQLRDGVVMERTEAYGSMTRKVSYQEFLRITENSEERYEYIDGELYLLASPKTNHQTVLGELYFLFAGWFRGKKCRPMLAPYDITLKRSEESINVVQPDLAVICDLEENLNEKDYYMGVPALVVEILSESTRGKDSVRKLDLYMSTGIGEYWLVNPWNREITVYRFENRELMKNATFRQGETAVSYTFEGLEVSVETIFK